MVRIRRRISLSDGAVPHRTELGGAAGEGLIVAADRLGAGPGETVLVATGSRVRDLVLEPSAPFKSLVVAIVDSAELGEPPP